MARVIIKFEDDEHGGISIQIYYRDKAPGIEQTKAESFSEWCFKHIEEVLNYWTKMRARKDLH